MSYSGKKACHIRAKPLDFRARNCENIRATDLSPPINETVPVRLYVYMFHAGFNHRKDLSNPHTTQEQLPVYYTSLLVQQTQYVVNETTVTLSIQSAS